jgi:hypothetical protein
VPWPNAEISSPDGRNTEESDGEVMISPGERGSLFVDMDGDVHSGYELAATGTGERDLDRNDLGDLLEVPGAVGLGKQRQDAGGRALDLLDRALDRHAGKSVDVDVDERAAVDAADVGLVDPGST